MVEKSFAETVAHAADDGRMPDSTLNERLRAVAEEVSRSNPEFAAVAQRMVERLEANEVGKNAPGIGEAMPDFVLPDENGAMVRLETLLKAGPVVLSFHRGHWCPYCRLNADGLAQIAPEIERLGAQIVAISPETHQYGAELKSQANAPFPVLCDLDNGYALQLNLLFWVGDEKREAMTKAGFDIAPYQGNDTWMLPVPATFVVDRGGIIRARSIDPDYRRRMELDDIVDAVAALDAVAEPRRGAAS